MTRRRFLATLAGTALAWKATMLEATAKPVGGPVLVEAGRRVDAPGADTARFPPSNVDMVRQRIQQVLAHEKPVALVSSAACGADLLALDVAGDIHIRRYVLLPSPPEQFRKSSVTDRPGNWGTLYDNVLKAAKVEVLTLPDGQEGYLQTNLKLLDQAESLARQYHTSTAALVIWNELSRGPDDVTAHFLDQARLRKIPVLEISTL
jgi:hypothetical protein